MIAADYRRMVAAGLAALLAARRAQADPQGLNAADTREGKPEGSACWMELENQHGCYLWNPNLAINETASWSGGCSSRFANGAGSITWVWGTEGEDQFTTTGSLLNGEQTGLLDLALCFRRRCRRPVPGRRADRPLGHTPG